ncbi:hypothetical protein [Propionivibrio sp.]|uniref:hypothetical protein n=1 Tax=Propionivibrio sp. TaxID=2212460 RepID=UPI00272EA1C6|nr:hypothetical protein [Propionivibrio sp.]
MKTFEWLLPALFLAASAVAFAGPAPWYQWRSVTGATVCAQTSPGPAWVRLEQPFVDPRCQRRDPSSSNSKTRSGK